MYKAELRTKGGNRSGQSTKLFTAEGADFLFIVTAERQKYWIPAAVVSGQVTVTLGSQYDLFKV